MKLLIKISVKYLLLLFAQKGGIMKLQEIFSKLQYLLKFLVSDAMPAFQYRSRSNTLFDMFTFKQY